MSAKKLKKLEELYQDFVNLVVKRAKTIDKYQEYDWYALSIGFALAKGFTPFMASEFACWARYTKEYKP